MRNKQILANLFKSVSKQCSQITGMSGAMPFYIMKRPALPYISKLNQIRFSIYETTSFLHQTVQTEDRNFQTRESSARCGNYEIA
jgi:hypothetical protein